MNTIPAAYAGLLSPDQTLIAVGNGTVSIAPVATGIPRYLCVGYAAGWSADSLSVGVSRNAGTPQQPTREFYLVDITTGAETKLDIDPAQLPGYSPQNAWENGLLISSVAGQQYQNGLPVPTEPNADPIQCRDSDASGDSWMYAIVGPWTAVIQSTDFPEIRIEGGITQTLINRIDAQPWVSANYAGMMFVRNPNGQTYQGPMGEGRGLVFQAQGQIYVVTTYYEGTATNPIPVWNIYRLSDWTATSPCVTLRGVWYVGMFVIVDGDTVTCFGSNQDNGDLTYETVNLATATWEPYVPPVVIPPQPPALPLIVIGPQRSLWRGSLSGIVRGSIGNEPDAVNLIEDARYVKPEQEPRLQCLFLDRLGDVNLTIAMAQRNRVPVALDPDGDPATAATMRQALHSASVRVMDARQQYPAYGEAPAAFIDRVAQSLTPVSIRPGYVFGEPAREAQVAECNLLLDQLIARSPQVIVDLSFGLDRPPKSAWCAEHFAKLCQATPWPTVPLRQPPPIVEVPPVVPPDPPKPPKLTFWQKLLLFLKGRRR